MVRILIGTVLGAIAMFVVGFIFWASPLANLGYSNLDEQRSAIVQTALAQNITESGRYIVPNPNTPGGTVLYGRGPVATVEYNSAGFSTAGTAPIIGGFLQELVVTAMITLALLAVTERVTDFASRARLAVGLTSAAAVMIQLSDPILNHASWRFAIYATVADLAMLTAASVVVAWFLPRTVKEH